MGRAKDDLAELVAFQSVADPKQYPPEECRAAADWVVDAFTDTGFTDMAKSPTPFIRLPGRAFSLASISHSISTWFVALAVIWTIAWLTPRPSR